jgi:hypothetical protein
MDIHPHLAGRMFIPWQAVGEPGQLRVFTAKIAKKPFKLRVPGALGGSNRHFLP